MVDWPDATPPPLFLRTHAEIVAHQLLGAILVRCRALAIDFSHHQIDITSPASDLWISVGEPVPDD